MSEAKCYKKYKGFTQSKDWRCSLDQLVPNMRKWILGIVIERVSARSYKVKTVKGGVYIRNKKLSGSSIQT